MIRRLVAVLGLAAVAAAAAGCGPRPSAAEGRELYAANGCANCHGGSGHGDGPIAVTLSPRPRDFRDRSAFRQGDSEAAIAATLTAGIRSGGAMPRYSHLSERERRSLAMFVRALQTTDQRRSEQP